MHTDDQDPDSQISKDFADPQTESAVQATDRQDAARGRDRRISTFLYEWRFRLTAVLLLLVVTTFVAGALRVFAFSEKVASLADTSNGTGAVKPLGFDPTMDIWFGEQDAAVQSYYEIERTFVAEDYVMVTFEVQDHEFGVFSRESLSAIARLTQNFLKVPGVRHVRSLTYNPWIRWGKIEDDAGSEEGLIISDLVEGDPAKLTDKQIVERMVAVLGAKRAAAKLGEARVRAVIGAGADFADYIGEPLLLGTIVNDDASATVIQIQVLRPHIAPDKLAGVFDDAATRKVASNLSSIEQQRAALRGIEHFLRLEKGLCLPTPERAQLATWIESMPAGDKKNALRVQLADPSKNFMADKDGKLVRKFFEYDKVGDGYADQTEPGDVVAAPAGFQPKARIPYEFHLGGIPLFERNFEQVGLADFKFVPLMFLVIMLVLVLVFRRVSGVLVPMSVVFGSIMIMVGSSLVIGQLLNNLTMMSPNMLTAVSIADAIHLVASWVILRGHYDDKRNLIIEVVRRNLLPVFLTSVTTAVGFASLNTSGIAPMRMLGTMAAFGTLFAWVLSMTLIPAFLSLVPHRKVTAKKSRVEAAFSPQRSAAFVNRVLAFRKPILAFSAGLLVVAMVGVARMTIDSDFRQMFPDDNKTMVDFNWIEARMGGVGDLELVFYGVDGGGERSQAPALTAEEDAKLTDLALRELGAKQQPEEFQALTAEQRQSLKKLRAKRDTWQRGRIGVSTAFLDSLERFERRLRSEMADPKSKLAVLTDLISPLDTLRKIHQVQNQNKAAYYRVPGDVDVANESKQPKLEYDEFTEEWSRTPVQDGSTLVAQYYLQYESGARPGESLSTQLSQDRTRFRMQGRVVSASSVAHLACFDRIEEIAKNEFPELAATLVRNAGDAESQKSAATHGDLTLSGKSLLFARTSDLFSNGFVKSMALALTVITILIGFIFRSWVMALISLIPNVLPILIPLSVFGLLGMPLDGPAILVSSVALGVCVDDTIHFFTKFVRARRRGKSAADALAHALVEAGAAMTVTTVVLIIGFGTLLLSDFAPNFQMGVLAAIMIGLAWAADFVVTAAVLSFDGKAHHITPDEVAEQPEQPAPEAVPVTN